MSTRKGGKAGGKGKEGGVSKNKQKKLRQAQLAVDTQNKLFNAHFSQQYGAERWDRLARALQKPTRHVALLNRHADPSFTASLLGIDKGATIPYLPHIFNNRVFAHNPQYTTEQAPLPTSPASAAEAAVDDERDCDEEEDANEADVDDRSKANSPSQAPTASEEHDDDISRILWPAPGSNLDERQLATYYPLDAASLFPALLLKVQPHHRVIDMCAAPGGKSLFILQYLALPHGHLTCNDVSFERKKRLERILRQYVPEDHDSLVDTIHGDGTTKAFLDDFGEGRKFDRILVDAPCASERHLIMKSPFFRPSSEPASPLLPSQVAALANDDFMSWAPGRSRANAERQLALLKAAAHLCAMDGVIVYSTCSINSMENDQVVEKILKKVNKKAEAAQFGYRLRLVHIEASTMPFGEPTQFGWHMLPDVCDGWGPIYMSVLEKVPWNDDEQEDSPGEDLRP